LRHIQSKVLFAAEKPFLIFAGFTLSQRRRKPQLPDERTLSEATCPLENELQKVVPRLVLKGRFFSTEDADAADVLRQRIV